MSISTRSLWVARAGRAAGRSLGDRLGRQLARVGPQRARSREDAGLGLLEMIVALMIIGIVMAGLAGVGIAGISAVGLARQRQAAVALADQAIEEVRALPFATVQAGLSTSDVSSGTDPNITACSSGTGYCYAGEELVTGDNSDVTPLVPHQQTITEDTVSYTVSVYDTYFDNDTTSGVYRVTALVTWVDPSYPGVTHRAKTQTLVSSPNGCESTTTHPYAAPCQPFFYASASDTGAQLTVDGYQDSPPIPALNVDHAVYDLTEQDANIQMEQVRSVQTGATTTGAAIYAPGDELITSTGDLEANAQASDDLSQSLPPYQTGSAEQSSTPISVSNDGTSLELAATPSDTAAAISAVTAGDPSSDTCTNSSGTDETTGQPCADASAQSLGQAGNAEMTLMAGSTSLGAALLASLAPAPQPGQAVDLFRSQAGSANCHGEPAASSGCIGATASRSLGTVELAGLPANLPASDVPAGWDGYLVELTNYSDTVHAEAGVGAGAPSATINSGAISYWNGSGYSSMTVPTAAGSSIPISTVSIQDTTNFPAPLDITMSAYLSSQGETIDDPASGCTAPCTRTSASATIGSPLSGYINYFVTYGGATIAQVHLMVDLGTLTASATYQAAPSAG